MNKKITKIRFILILSANLMPKFLIIDFFNRIYYYLNGQYIKPYHLLVSPPFDVLVGISYGPPLTDPF